MALVALQLAPHRGGVVAQQRADLGDGVLPGAQQQKVGALPQGGLLDIIQGDAEHGELSRACYALLYGYCKLMV